MNIDDLIENIVFWIFNSEVDLDDPYQTIEQIKEKVNAELEKENDE